MCLYTYIRLRWLLATFETFISPFFRFFKILFEFFFPLATINYYFRLQKKKKKFEVDRFTVPPIIIGLKISNFKSLYLFQFYYYFILLEMRFHEYLTKKKKVFFRKEECNKGYRPPTVFQTISVRTHCILTRIINNKKFFTTSQKGIRIYMQTLRNFPKFLWFFFQFPSFLFFFIS